MKRFTQKYTQIIAVENILKAWQEFLPGKKNRKDVAIFQVQLMDHILALHNELLHKYYIHEAYSAFNISDPKPRHIHKATVRDRLLHHVIYTSLYPYFDTKFIHDSYSCRVGKGTHKAVYRFEKFARMVSKNHTRTCWVLKCDIKKFFANIDHAVLKSILQKHIEDDDVLWLLCQVIDSFNTDEKEGIGLPLGNLTSQLLVNVYMNEFDQFVKRKLKHKNYIRYADDFVFLSVDKNSIEALIPIVELFLKEELKLSLHEHKVFIKTYSSGVDFLGWIQFVNYRVLRTTTKRRMIKRLEGHPKQETVSSYRGLLKHGDTYELQKVLGLDTPFQL